MADNRIFQICLKCLDYFDTPRYSFYPFTISGILVSFVIPLLIVNCFAQSLAEKLLSKKVHIPRV